MTKKDEAGLTIAIDIGGTFTDIILLDRGSGRIWRTKTPSTPEDQSIGFAAGIEKVSALAERTAGESKQILHATTVATNLILESKGADVALVTSAGFRHVLEIGRHDIPNKENPYSWIKPTRPVPPERIFEVAGRIDVSGSEIEPLSDEDVASAATEINRLGIRSVAVCLVNSYASSAHERRVGEKLHELCPDVVVSLSGTILPVFREYERSMLTVLNAYVAPAVAGYVGKLEQRLQDLDIDAPLLLMKSNGGVASASTVSREPVQTALSGPAAGVVGASFFGRLAGFENIIGVDIGGTSADISVILDGMPNMTTESRIANWPMTLPMIDIHTIGAGGGSIAEIVNGTLKVGPSSAGAVPGPVCYRKGGTRPTVTDAHVVLGHLPPYLMNGEMSLDVDAASEAIEREIAAPLGIGLHEAARGILELANNKMMGAIRLVSVERGLDPHDFALMAFGGAGPLHGAALAQLLGIRTVIVPPAPGVLSAMGLLVSNLRSEFSQTLNVADSKDAASIARIFGELEALGRAWLEKEGVPEDGRSIHRTAEMRYLNQGFELSVPWIGDEVTSDTMAATIEKFHEKHSELYTFSQPDVPVELVTLRVSAEGLLPTPAFSEISSGKPLDACILGHTTIAFESGARKCPIYDRESLEAGAVAMGPAVFVQIDTTIVLLPGQRATVDKFGSLIISNPVDRKN